MILLINYYFRSLQDNIRGSILPALSKLYVYALILYLGYYFSETLSKNIQSYLPLIILGDLLLRVTFYTASSFRLVPFLLLAPKSTLTIFKLYSIVLSILNLTWCIFGAVLANRIAPDYIIHFMFCGMAIGISHSLVTFMIREGNIRSWFFILGIAFYLLLIILGLWDIDYLVTRPTLIVALLLAIGCTFGLSAYSEIYRYWLYKPSSITYNISHSQKAVGFFRFILRNRRVREHLLFNLFFVNIIFFPVLWELDVQSHPNQALFFSMLSTGIVHIGIGQFFIAWDSSYFPFMLMNKSWNKHINERFNSLSRISSIVLGGQGLVLLWNNQPAIIFLLLGFLFNIGILFFSMMWTATNNTRRIELDRTVLFNSSGSKPTQLLTLFACIGCFLILFEGLISITNVDIAILISSLVTLIPILFRKKITEKIAERIAKYKYSLFTAYAKS